MTDRAAVRCSFFMNETVLMMLVPYTVSALNLHVVLISIYVISHNLDPRSRIQRGIVQQLV